jgi:hypothetical protein
MDPRIKSILSNDEKESARTYLESFYNLILNVELEETTAHSDVSVNSSNSNPTVDYPFELFLKSQENVNQIEVINEHIKVEFSKFETKARIRGDDFKIIKYWYSIRKEFPKLFKISNFLFATPATQLSVETFCSTLVFIVNNNRANLSKDLINDIIIVKMNKFCDI